jgi:hypothetical protein
MMCRGVLNTLPPPTPNCEHVFIGGDVVTPESQDLCGSRCFPSGVVASLALPESAGGRNVNSSGAKQRVNLAAADVTLGQCTATRAAKLQLP